MGASVGNWAGQDGVIDLNDGEGGVASRQEKRMRRNIYLSIEHWSRKRKVAHPAHLGDLFGVGGNGAKAREETAAPRIVPSFRELTVIVRWIDGGMNAARQTGGSWPCWKWRWMSK